MCVCVHACCNRQGREHCDSCSAPQRHAEPDAMGNTTPNNNKASVLSPRRNAPDGISPAPGASSRSARRAGRGGSTPLAPKGNCRARLVPPVSGVPPGTGASWPHGTCPSRPAGAAAHKRPQRVGEPQAQPPLSATPGHVPSASQTPSTRGGLLLSPQLLSASVSAGTLPGTTRVPRARGARPPHSSASPGIPLPQAGDGHRQPPGSGQTQSP